MAKPKNQRVSLVIFICMEEGSLPSKSVLTYSATIYVLLALYIAVSYSFRTVLRSWKLPGNVQEPTTGVLKASGLTCIEFFHRNQSHIRISHEMWRTKNWQDLSSNAQLAHKSCATAKKSHRELIPNDLSSCHLLHGSTHWATPLSRKIHLNKVNRNENV